MREKVMVAGQSVNILVEKHPVTGWAAVGEYAGTHLSIQGSSPSVAIKRWRDAVSSKTGERERLQVN
jgi:hypothetical protein